MDAIIETLSIALLLTVILIPIVALAIIYLVKRYGFYVNANCWFCNQWTKVPYADRNSFYCPFCSQYNGFTKNGEYNKVIEAQFSSSFDKYYSKSVKQRTVSASNGLCAYCNNNQQLKVRLLANFVPLNEKNYDIEVEHFQAQLEKSYKLCKKCDKVLKTTLEKQHAWIFGNHIKNIRRKGLILLKSTKTKISIEKKWVILNCVRFCLFVLSVVILCHIFNLEVISLKKVMPYEFKKYMPKVFVPYILLLNDLKCMASNMLGNFTTNMNTRLDFSDFGNSFGIKNNTLPFTWAGLFFEVILIIWQPKSTVWKVNDLMSWIILWVTSFCSFEDVYLVYVHAIQTICIIANIYSLSKTHPERKQMKYKKYAFKKLQASTEMADYSDNDEDIFEDISDLSHFSSTQSEKSHRSNNSDTSQQILFQGMFQNTANFNNTFYTAKSTGCSSIFNSSPKRDGFESSNDLNRSLDNLHLSNTSFKPLPCTSTVFSVSNGNRPILSPPKLKNITQNSWTAGGFWKNDVPAFATATNVNSLSRSSSQSSGFVSNTDVVAPNVFNSLPASREHSLNGDLDRKSIFSEPAYHFKPINSFTNTNQPKNNVLNTFQKVSVPSATPLYYKAENNMFYPILKENNMLFIQGTSIPRFNFESKFDNLSLNTFNGNSRFSSSALFSEKPVASRLFKNINYISPQSQSFSTPR